MLRGSTLTLLYVALSILAAVGKGSDSPESSQESSEESEDYGSAETGDKKAGVQHKFWIPTYQGTNPLNRRKIGITSSEIEKYDRTIDVSLSGVYKNKTKHPKPNKDEDTLSMPIIWSGEDENINNTRKYDISVESTRITLESSRESSLEQNSSFETLSKHSSKQTGTPESKAGNRKKLNEGQIKDQNKKKKYLEKEITSNFFEELGKAASNQTATINSDYYKNAVKYATENTKRKLGYRKQKDVKYEDKKTIVERKMGKNRKKALKPELIAVNIDSKSLEIENKEDEIEFKTSHKQYTQQEILKSPSTKSKMNGTNSKQDSSYQESQEYISEETKEETEDSFTEFCDYSAWSDVLCRNKTQRKASQRKPKTKPISSAYMKSREIGRPLRKRDKDKAEKLRQKEGKTSRKKKWEREIRKKQSKRNKGEKQDYYDQEDYPEKKLRMRTKGEKQHAIKEVKGYLQEMDKKYGGRPGRDNYKSSDDRRDRRFGRREFGGGEQRKGRDRRRNKWDDRENEGDGRWSQRDYDERGRDDREGDWDRRSRRERGPSRGGRQRGGYDDRRRGYDDRRRGYDDRRRGYDDRRGRREYSRSRGSGRGGFRSRGGGRDDYRGRGGRRDTYRGRNSGRDGRGGRGERESYRGRDNGRGGRDIRKDE